MVVSGAMYALLWLSGLIGSAIAVDDLKAAFRRRAAIPLHSTQSDKTDKA